MQDFLTSFTVYLLRLWIRYEFPMRPYAVVNVCLCESAIKGAQEFMRSCTFRQNSCFRAPPGIYDLVVGEVPGTGLVWWRHDGGYPNVIVWLAGDSPGSIHGKEWNLGSNTQRLHAQKHIGRIVCLLRLYVVLSCLGRGLCDGLITRPGEFYCVSNSVWLRNLN
jgi:hypothetical protein